MEVIVSRSEDIDVTVSTGIVTVSVKDDSTVVDSMSVSRDVTRDVISEVIVDAGSVNVLERMLVTSFVSVTAGRVTSEVNVEIRVETSVTVVAGSVTSDVMVERSVETSVIVVPGRVIVLAGSTEVNIEVTTSSLVKTDVTVSSLMIVLAGRTEVMNDVKVPKDVSVVTCVTSFSTVTGGTLAQDAPGKCFPSLVH